MLLFKNRPRKKKRRSYASSNVTSADKRKTLVKWDNLSDKEDDDDDGEDEDDDEADEKDTPVPPSTPATDLAPSSSSESACGDDIERRPLPSMTAATHTDQRPLSLVLYMSDDQRIGGGKRSTVYRAAIDDSKTPVAVTVMPNVRGKRLVDQVDKEAQTLMQLPHHKNLVRHHGIVRLNKNRTVGIVSDLLEDHQSLDERLYYGTPIPDEDKLQLMLRILDRLIQLHAHDTTHRNFSLRQVMVTNDLSAVKIIGFGLPTLCNAAAMATNSNGFRQAYASPELVKGQLRCDDIAGWKKSDVYSFTVAMGELLVEEPPWAGELSVVVMAALIENQQPYSTTKVTVGGKPRVELDTAMKLALSADPGQRPSADMLRATLSDCISAWTKVGDDDRCMNNS